MPGMHITFDEKTLRRLTHAAQQLGRTIHDLASSAVEEAANDYANAHPEADADVRGLNERPLPVIHAK